MRTHFSSGSSFERDIGYSRAVVDGQDIFVSGTTGFDYATMTIAESVIDQAEQACKNIGKALQFADSSFADVVRVRYIVPDVEDFAPCWPTLCRYPTFGIEWLPHRAPPAANILDRKTRRVAIDSDVEPAQVVPDVIDAVRTGQVSEQTISRSTQELGLHVRHG
jgi:enamine deaminase RidA (YjgF/YER057c/UK114 family)